MLYIHEENHKQFVTVGNVKFGAESISAGASFIYVGFDEAIMTKKQKQAVSHILERITKIMNINTSL